MVALPWGSRSISRTRRLVAVSEAARLTAVVVFPTPPFWFATAMTRFMTCSIWVGRERVPQDAARRPARALSADEPPALETIWTGRRSPRPAAFPSSPAAARPEHPNDRRRPQNPPVRTGPAPPLYRKVRTAYSFLHEHARLEHCLPLGGARFAR